MKVRIFHDLAGSIKSVLAADPKAGTTPLSADHQSVEIDLTELNVSSIAEVHLRFRVDELGKVVPRDPELDRQALQR
jgi:hypothetical protein